MESPGQDTGVGSLSFRQGIFPSQGSNPGLPRCRWILHQLSHVSHAYYLVEDTGGGQGGLPSRGSWGATSRDLWGQQEPLPREAQASRGAAVLDEPGSGRGLEQWEQSPGRQWRRGMEGDKPGEGGVSDLHRCGQGPCQDGVCSDGSCHT